MSGSAGSYYLPNPSPWPIIASIGLFCLGLGAAMLMNDMPASTYLLGIGTCIVLFMMFGWWGRVISESRGGNYNDEVDLSFRMTMGWFIFSEVMFFAGFFGALFYARVLSVPWLADEPLLWDYAGGWPTAGPDGPIHAGQNLHGVAEGQFATIGAWGIPLWNTLILLASSVTCTFAHHALRENKRTSLIVWLAVTVALGAVFMYFQVSEYKEAYTQLGLTMGTGVYGATFFMLTGFHGFHVTMGAIILLIILVRCMFGHFKPADHFAFEAGAWYWHFVDTVWVGLFIFVYIL